MFHCLYMCTFIHIMILHLTNMAHFNLCGEATTNTSVCKDYIMTTLTGTILLNYSIWDNSNTVFIVELLWYIESF